MLSVPLMALLSLEFSVFVGDLSSEVDDYQLHQFFLKKYPSCKGGKVVSDQYGNSRYERWTDIVMLFGDAGNAPPDLNTIWM